VAPTSAVLTGLADPHGARTRYAFQYGTTAGYGKRSPVATLPANAGTKAVSVLVKSLEPGTRYHYRLVALSSGGIAFGADQTFATTAARAAKRAPAARVRLVTRHTRLRHGRVIRLRVRCSRRVSFCTGKVKLRTVRKLGARRRTLGTHGFRASGGKRRGTHVRLTRRRARLVARYARRHRRMRVRVAMVSRNPQGHATRTKGHFILKLRR
jgi:hypothetical protein